MTTGLINPEEQKRVRPPRNWKHRQFCEAFVAQGMLNGAAAAREAGYPKKTAGIQAAKLMRRPEVVRYINHHAAIWEQNIQLKRAKLIAKMWRVLDFNPMRAAAESKNGFIEIDADRYEEIADQIGDCVSEIEAETKTNRHGEITSTVRIKFMSKDKMFELALKYYRMLEEDGSININLQQQQNTVLDFDQLCSPPDFTSADLIEEQIEKGAEK